MVRNSFCPTQRDRSRNRRKFHGSRTSLGRTKTNLNYRSQVYRISKMIAKDSQAYINRAQGNIQMRINSMMSRILSKRGTKGNHPAINRTKWKIGEWIIRNTGSIKMMMMIHILGMINLIIQLKIAKMKLGLRITIVRTMGEIERVRLIAETGKDKKRVSIIWKNPRTIKTTEIE